jgi:hypothetical protein
MGLEPVAAGKIVTTGVFLKAERKLDDNEDVSMRSLARRFACLEASTDIHAGGQDRASSRISDLG